jgi:soluble lytic murein transglycosylase
VARLQARYWHARASERAGRPDAAARFAELAHEFPLSYYGWRASERVGEGANAPVPPPLERGTAALAPAQLERPRILIEAGLIEYAREELDALFAGARGLDDRLALARLYADAGDFHRPQRLAVDAYAETLARGPRRDALELWWYAWPAPWTDAVNRVAQARTGLPPELVYAIMREESGYQPAVMSVAGARGLLQLMPETAERVARDLALPEFHPDDLFDPAVNIQLGGVYLDQLLRQFSGRASAAIGSYNAGPHRVVAWLDGSGLEDDEWVEAIPYDQTREYVKRVLRSVHAYKVLY